MRKGRPMRGGAGRSHSISSHNSPYSSHRGHLPALPVRVLLLLALAALTLAFGSLLSSSGRVGATAPANVATTSRDCNVPADVSLVFDHSGSMSQSGKLANAQSATTGFIDQMAGGTGDLTPNHISLAGFSAGDASADVPLTTDAATLKNAI